MKVSIHARVGTALFEGCNEFTSPNVVLFEISVFTFYIGMSLGASLIPIIQDDGSIVTPILVEWDDFNLNL
jgi:hypothetical protein